MNFEEFLRKDTPETDESLSVETEEVIEAPELDVQKAVVEELAADKAALDEKVAAQTNALKIKDAELSSVSAENIRLKAAMIDFEKNLDEINSLKAELEALKEDKNRIEALKTEISALKTIITALEIKLSTEQAKKIDEQDRNPNALALLDREVELPDRFPGESRDHVLEVIKEARDKSETEGRARRAQILEAVLVANEPNGMLAKKRAALAKLFADNGNLITGSVLEELQKLGIPHKNGEEYLLPDEILKRTY